MNRSDEELLEGFKQGVVADFETLVKRYQDRITQFARWHCGPEDAEDVAQEVFVHLFRSARRFEGRSRFRTWFYAMARNTCLSALRRRGRANVVDIASAQHISDGMEGVQLMLEQAESDQAVRAAVERLTPLHRECLLLREWEEMSYEEIAHVLGVPTGTVRSRIHNARVALARELKGASSGSRHEMQ